MPLRSRIHAGRARGAFAAALLLAACDGDPSGPSGARLTAEDVAGRYAVCALRFVPEGAQPEVNIVAAAFETGTSELAVDRGSRDFELEYVPRGEFADRELTGTYSLGTEELTLNFTVGVSARERILLPERIRLAYQASPRRLTADGSVRHDVPRGEYARLAGIPETGLADRIPGRLHATFGSPNCG